MLAFVPMLSWQEILLLIACCSPFIIGGIVLAVYLVSKRSKKKPR